MIYRWSGFEQFKNLKICGCYGTELVSWGMAYHMHPHLVEIKDFLECSGKDVGKNGKTLFKRFPGNTTILIRHDDEFCEVVIKPVNFSPTFPAVEIRVSCREFALDRLQTFTKRCAQLKSWLRILGEKSNPSRSRL